MKTAKVLWLVACGIVLLVTLHLFDPDSGRDADVILTYGMLVLTFPSSLIVAGVIALLTNVIPLDAYYGRVAIFAIWVLFVAAGYVQWFKCLPWAVRKVRNAQQRKF